LLVWLAPTLAAMFAWGIAQGLVKKYIGEVPPARFCLYYAVANAAVNILFWASQDAPPILAPEGRVFLMVPARARRAVAIMQCITRERR
jgi:hypothetical protein